jgi:hypothetical protein
MNYTCKDLTEKELYFIKYTREYETYIWITIILFAIIQGCIRETTTNKTPMGIFIQYLRKKTLNIPQFIKIILVIVISIGVGDFIPTIKTQIILAYLLTFYILN